MKEILNLLGIASRAKKILYGAQMFDDFKKVKLLIITNDISSKSKERYLKKCHYYDVECLELFDSNTLSKALGKRNLKAIGLIDDGFKKSLLEKI